MDDKPPYSIFLRGENCQRFAHRSSKTTTFSVESRKGRRILCLLMKKNAAKSPASYVLGGRMASQIRGIMKIWCSISCSKRKRGYKLMICNPFILSSVAERSLKTVSGISLKVDIRSAGYRTQVADVVDADDVPDGADLIKAINCGSILPDAPEV